MADSSQEWFLTIWDYFAEITNGLPRPVTGYCFAPPHNWLFDFAFPEQGLAVEIERGTWVWGQYNRPAGFELDCEKYNAAVLAGWRVLRYTPSMINADPRRIIEMIASALSL